jgi:hypothetical protein
MVAEKDRLIKNASKLLALLAREGSIIAPDISFEFQVTRKKSLCHAGLCLALIATAIENGITPIFDQGLNSSKLPFAL